MHKLVRCLSQVSSRQFSLITNPLKNLFVFWWWESCNWTELGIGLLFTKLLLGQSRRVSWRQCIREQTFQLQPIREVGEIWTSPAAERVPVTSTTFQRVQTEKLGHDFQFDREGVCWQWMNLPVTSSFVGGKKTNFKCHGNKNTPSLHFVLSLWTNAVLVFKTTFQMTIRFLNRKSTVPSTDRKITASSYYLVIWKIFDRGNKVLHWRAWVISCRQKKQNQITVKPTFTPKTCEHPTWAQ